MSLRERRGVDVAMRAVLGVGDELPAEPVWLMSEISPFPPKSSTRRTALPSSIVPVDPVGGEIFRSLRDLRADFGRGGLPPRDERTPEDEARIAAFCVLQELVHILDQFRRVIEQGEQCRLVVSERGRQLNKVIIEITIEDTCW